MKQTLFSGGWLLSAPGTHGRVPVDLPSDYAVTRPRTPDAPGGAGNGFFVGGRATYVKYFTPSGAPHQILDIDGAYMCSQVHLNGDLLAFHPHGYTPYLVDLGARAVPGTTNKLVVTTDDMAPSMRWYAGAGLFRDVFLWEGGAVRLEPRDVFITTPDTATVRLCCVVSADRPASVTLRARVRDASGAVAAEGALPLLAAEPRTSAVLTLALPGARLWSPDDPYLYTMETVLEEGGAEADADVRPFGVRVVTADAVHGLRINGRPLKLRGGCIHHDHGALGAAAWPAAERRKLEKLQSVGFNAIRCAHNPPSRALLDLCDRMGILVMDEAFDMWNAGKCAHDYHLFFADHWAQDIDAMVLRDRSHPSVISYSIGNEIIERDGSSDGAAWAARLAARIRENDPTRLVTSGVCGLWERPDADDPPEYVKSFGVGEHILDEAGDDITWVKKTEAFMAPLDIVGYNYLYERYEKDHEKYPERVIWGSETHALRFWHSWQAVKRCPHVLGDFTWTAYDNLGEAGTGRSAWARDGHIPGISLAAWPWRSCYQGDFDLCGFRRPQSYFREAIWRADDGIYTEPRIFTTHPSHTGEGFSGTGWHWYDVLDTWTFGEEWIGCSVKCEVYTAAERIVWTLNGEKVGESAAAEGVASIGIPYAPGTLTATAMVGGRVVGTSSLSTVGTPAALTVAPERPSLCADGRDLAYFSVTVTDARGRRVPDAACALRAHADGGELVAFFSGDPKNEDAYGTDACHAFCGHALAVVRTRRPGEVLLTVGGDGLAGAAAAVTAE